MSAEWGHVHLNDTGLNVISSKLCLHFDTIWIAGEFEKRTKKDVNVDVCGYKTQNPNQFNSGMLPEAFYLSW